VFIGRGLIDALNFPVATQKQLLLQVLRETGALFVVID
jgi:hypothetical protein